MYTCAELKEWTPQWRAPSLEQEGEKLDRNVDLNWNAFSH